MSAEGVIGGVMTRHRCNRCCQIRREKQATRPVKQGQTGSFTKCKLLIDHLISNFGLGEANVFKKRAQSVTTDICK